MPPKKREPRQPAAPSPSVTPGSTMTDSPSPSSLVTEANSSLFGKPRARQYVGRNKESSNLVPASPQSFSSPNVDSPLIPNQQGSTRKALQKGKEPARKKPKIAAENTCTNQDQYIQQQSLKIQEEQSWVQHHPHPQVYNNMQPHGMPPPALRRQHLSPALARLKMFLNDLRRRPADNSSEFWHRLVAMYYAPQAKHRWCFSSCDDMDVVEQYAQKAMQGWCFSLYDSVAGCGATKDVWKCDLCRASSGKGFEATCQNLPRLYQIKFEQGLIEEFYKFGKPSETRHPSGIVVLEFAEASLQSNYAQEHTDHKGRLRILFTPDFKILQWNFCVQRHEEFLRRSSLAPQVNLFNFAAHKIQSALAKSGPDGLSPEELQNFSNMLMATTDLLVKTLETQSFTGLGLPIGFASTLQMSEVVSSAKSSIDVSQDHYSCPVGLHDYVQQNAVTGSSANLNPGQFQQGPNLQMHSGAYIAQQNDNRPYRERSFAQDLMNYVQQTSATGTSVNLDPSQFKQGPNLQPHRSAYTAQQNYSTGFPDAVHPMIFANPNQNKYHQGRNLQACPGAYMAQQNDNPELSDAGNPLKPDVGQQVWENWLYNGKQAPRQSSSDPTLSGMGSCDARHPLMSDGARQTWTNMANNPSDAPKRSIVEPCNAGANAEGEAPILSSGSVILNAGANAEGEAPILSSGSVKNDSVSARSPASISNSAAGTLLDFNSAAQSGSPSSSDSAGTPQNLQRQEMNVHPVETNPLAQELDDVWKDLGDIEGVNYDNLL